MARPPVSSGVGEPRVSVLETLTVDDLIALRSAFDDLADGAGTMEEMAAGITGHLFAVLREATGGPACALVRLYKTHRYDALPPRHRDFAARTAREPLSPSTRCLTLLGSAGIEPAWNDPARSEGHQAIPLTSEAVVEKSPMIAHLIAQLGLDVAEVVRPDPLARIDRHHERYDIFYVPEARRSPSVPAQKDFVVPYEVRSTVGCGGLLPSGDMFALVLFARVAVPPRTAELFRTVALSVKSAIIPYTFKTFAR
jgi:hypothetical protein